jgi:hypothetical protein
MHRKYSLIFALGLASATTMSSERAEAATTTCSVNSVGWTTLDGGTLQVLCNGTYYYAYGAGSCPNIDAESRRMWLSLAEGALLSGRRVNINYSACGSANALTYLRIEP